MARMIPSVISPEIKSSAERRIFEWFENDPATADWIVLHSLGIANHNKIIYGETDFFVLVPGLGLFALEVKGGRVKRENGIWHFTNRYGKVSKKERGPFEQAYDGAFSIVNSLKAKLDRNHKHIEHIFWGAGVMFPDIEYKATGIDEEQWQVFDCKDGQSIGPFVRRLFEGSKKKWEKHYGILKRNKLPTVEDIEHIAFILRGDFDKAVAMSVQLNNAEDSLIKLTEEQYRCLDQLDDNPRCLIQGPAGTGKTLLAVEEAKKSAAQGEKVALFCFNANLGDWLNSYFSEVPVDLRPVYIGTFHKFLLRTIKETGGYIQFPRNEAEFPQFYSEDLPSSAKTALQNFIGKFDKIIVDEAQDLIQTHYLDIFDMCLKRGFVRGRWTMFGDFSMQAIFSGNNSGEELREMLEERTAFIKFKLTVNCRNTKPIFEEIQTVTGFKAPARLWNKVDGPPVNYITYINQAEQKNRLLSLLTSLMENNVPEKNITILSPVRRENSVISLIDNYNIQDFHVSVKNGISFCTIQAYKGLENMVVILTDINSFQSEKLMYVALSRARCCLYILESESGQKEYLELQRRRFML